MNEIAVIDADLIGRKHHRFPNLCCMKISGYFKAYGWHVELKTDYHLYDDVCNFKTYTGGRHDSKDNAST